MTLRAPFPYHFGGKSAISETIWAAIGRVKQYVEPFCGSAAALLACPHPASLEVVGDQNRHLANFWRAVKYQPDEVARWADYPVSHIDLAARHAWLTAPARTDALDDALRDPEWPGDARHAGWWVWGQCAWIGSGWCERPVGVADGLGKKPYADLLGKGIQSQIPHVGNAGRGVQSKIPHVGNAGRGVQSKIPHVGDAGRGVQSTHGAPSRGEHILAVMRALARRLEDVRVIHGSWDRCLNVHYGDKGRSAGILLDPPYLAYEGLYTGGADAPVAREVAEWAAREGGAARIVLCGHVGDYDAILPGDWRVVRWSRGRLTYGGAKTTDQEALYLSPSCLPVEGEVRLREAPAADGGEDEGAAPIGRPTR